MPFNTTKTISKEIYFSTDAGYVYKWDTLGGGVAEVLQTGLGLTDIAFAPDGALYGITSTDLYKFDLASGASTRVGALTGAVTPFISSLTNANGLDISESGEARVSSGNLSIVATVDLATAVVSNPYGPSLGQGVTAAGDILFDDDGYFASTNSYTLLKIVPGTVFPEIRTENDWVGSQYDGLAAAPVGMAGLSAGDLIGFANKSAYDIKGGTFGLVSYKDFAVLGSITGAAQLTGKTAATPTPTPAPPSLPVLTTQGKITVADYDGSGFDATRAYSAAGLQVAGDYKVVYSGLPFWNNLNLGLTTSSDAASWTKHSSNQLIPEAQEPSFASFRMAAGDLLYEKGQYTLYFDGNNINDQQSSANIRGIGRATSQDGVTWSFDANPIFVEQGGGQGFQVQSVVKLGATYFMYMNELDPGVSKKLVATSTDGKTFSAGQAFSMGDEYSVVGAEAVGGQIIAVIQEQIAGAGNTYYTAVSSDGLDFTLTGEIAFPSSFTANSYSVADIFLDGANVQILLNEGVGNVNWNYGNTNTVMTTLAVSDFTNGAPTTAPTYTTQQIFKDEGKLSFMADLALAAYHLDKRETIKDLINDYKPQYDSGYQNVIKYINPLTSNDISISKTKTNKFGQDGFENGIFTRKNAAAFVGRSEDSLFLSFRGTNDNEGEAGLFTLPNSPDERDWLLRSSHYALFKELIKEIKKYIKDQKNTIDEIYITGHSLGAAMVEAFLNFNGFKIAGATVHPITFANPGYDFTTRPFGDSRVTDLLIKGDPISPLGYFLGDNFIGKITGENNKIHHNLDKYTNYDTDNLHSMQLYQEFMDFIFGNGLSEKDINGKLKGVDYDSIYAYSDLVQIKTKIAGQNITTYEYNIGSGSDSIKGKRSDDIILGGAEDDTLKGKKGDDYIDGGSENDTLVGGKGKDYLIGGDGADTFEFNSVTEISSVKIVGKRKVKKLNDTIEDFEVDVAGEVIDLSGIDAKTKGLRNIGDQAFKFSAAGFSGKQGELTTTKKANATFVTGDVDGDGNADFRLVLTGSLDLTANDFVL